ncbi:APC family permease [Fangia hongkongensis]|uniref:APC family permease n=1 Tax=Fangia hongkongensis TaxID=270495 RepID=UPI000368867F|nr:APC family permease [Fangia hongkongensis]MBK2125716.1 APC family permease [Fangia hongkongensis]
MEKSNKLSTLQIILLSTGGMIGTGWLFSPYYGFQMAGGWVLISWLITAVLVFLVALSFAEVASSVPVNDNFVSYTSKTHSNSFSFLIMSICWLSYVVYLPLEAQGVTQYLGFWFPALVDQELTGTVLSDMGLIVALLIMFSISAFNSLHIKKVASTNMVLSLIKISIPLIIATIVIVVYGKSSTAVMHFERTGFDLNIILITITSTGLAFAFTGFQNGLIFARQAKNPRLALPLSVFFPVIVGFIMYALLSLVFILCLPEASLKEGSMAPFLGILSLLTLNILVKLLFIDAVVAPFGTGNVYAAVSARILNIIADKFSLRVLVRLNSHGTPANCVWFNFVIGLIFLLPFPSWTELVSFLSSLVMLVCIVGPISLLVFRRRLPEIERPFRVRSYRIVGHLSFYSCLLLVYFSGLKNTFYIVILMLALSLIYHVFLAKRYGKIKLDMILLIGLLFCMLLDAWLQYMQVLSFIESLLVLFIVSVVFMSLLTSKRQTKKEIQLEAVAL